MRDAMILVDAKELIELRRLQQAVLVLCNPDRWTPERTEAWRAITGKEQSRYVDLYEMAKEIDNEQE